jgi:DNA-binding IclR family transcriptional regulator
MDSVTGVGTLDKAMSVLRCVAEAPRTLGELTTATGLPRATAHRLASALADHGVLRRDRQGRYDLGHGLVALGRAAAERFPIVERARPVLESLRDDTGEGVQLFVRTGDRRCCVISLESPHGLRWIVPEGALLPLEVGSAGRVLLGEPASAGWVESVGEREAGVASVSAPVRQADGAVVAAVSVSGPIERLTEHPGRRFGPAVVAAALAIT